MRIAHEAEPVGPQAHCDFLSRVCSLYNNQIGDDGVAALTHTMRDGALQKLTALLLNNNRIGCAGASALADAASKSLDHLEKLCLSSNQIGNLGLAALASAAASGRLSAIRFLVLESNDVGDVSGSPALQP